MEPHLKKTVDDLLARLRSQEKQVADTKRMVNSLCELGGEPPMFAVVDDAPTLTTIKADTFYGQAFATAATAYLRMRKAKNMGPATVNDIYEALKQGGYQFDAKNEDYAKRGIRNSLGKNTVTFHRVPNGEFGLLEWYPDVKKKAKTSTNTDELPETDNEDEREATGAHADDEPVPDLFSDDEGFGGLGPSQDTAKSVAPEKAVPARPRVELGKVVNGKFVPTKPATKADV